MLIMFRAKNFSSFHDEVILDMRATSYVQHPSHVVDLGDLRILKTAAIYGANASGKSNLISALYCFERFVLNHLFEKLEEEEKKKKIPIRPFLLTHEADKTIEFEIIFLQNEILYQYGFSFADESILSEWLFINNEMVYEREEISSIQYGNKYRTQLKDLKKVIDDRLYLSVLDFFGTEQIKELVDNFKSFFHEKFNVYFEVFFEASIKGTFGVVGLSKKLVEDDAFRKKVVEYIRAIDVGIEDLIIVKERSSSVMPTESNEEPIPKTVHKIYDKNGIVTGSILFDLKQESTGTVRFLSFIQEVLIMLESGGVFVVDELSVRLHPMLTKFIIDMFQSDMNKNKAQLIFTTHDTSILNKDQFRRDEILFVDKNEKGESTLYSLADIKTIRQDASFSKDYFNGKYGAIPIFKALSEENGGE